MEALRAVFRGDCRPRVLLRVFPEDLDGSKTPVFDPQGPAITLWNNMFLSVSLVSLFIDPLFLFSPKSTDQLCVKHDADFDLLLSIFRSLGDIVYLINVLLQFRTAYSEPSSRVLGRGELVVDSRRIALRYLARDFWIDVLAALPVPQLVIWVLIPKVDDSLHKSSLRYSIVLQYLLRLVLVFLHTSKISKATGAVPQTAWCGAAFNMMLYYLISNVAGACWYLLALQRQEECWRSVCQKEKPPCKYSFFNCDTVKDPGRRAWLATSNVTSVCDPNQGSFDYGIYQIALQVGVASSLFLQKYFYSFWWGFQNLRYIISHHCLKCIPYLALACEFCVLTLPVSIEYTSFGNNLSTSSSVVENIFTNLVAVTGLVLLALLIGNVERYLQSLTLRLDEQWSKRTDTEQWMHHKQLPSELRQWVRTYDQYKWVATRGVDEEAIIQDLPTNLRRKINRHLCFNLLKKVPIFDQMEDSDLDGICDRIKATFCIEGAFLFAEGEPVNKMVFIIRGNVDSYTTNGGQAGFFNSSNIGPGNFCGEELLTWALDPGQSPALPASTRTVKAVSDVEAFFLAPDDLTYVATQFRKLHSKKVVHTFRLHSHQWRTWAACYIQSAWKRYKRHKELGSNHALSDHPDVDPDEIYVPHPESGLAECTAKVMRTIKRGSSNRFGPDYSVFSLFNDT